MPQSHPSDKLTHGTTRKDTEHQTATRQQEDRQSEASILSLPHETTAKPEKNDKTQPQTHKNREQLMNLLKLYYSKFDRDHFLSIKIYIVNGQIHGRVCTPYNAYCSEQQLVCIAVLMKVYTLHTLQMNPYTLKIMRNTAFQLEHLNCQFSFSNHEKDLI